MYKTQMNIQVRHISTATNALGTNHDETSDAETNLNNFCAVPCKGSMRKFEQDAGGGQTSVLWILTRISLTLGLSLAVPM